MRVAVAAGIAILMSSGAAYAAAGLSVREVAKVKASETDIWAKFGAFCAIKDWHPAVANCEESAEGDAKFRTLTLQDGGKIKEKLTGSSATGYTYQIIESPLPVKDYFASFSAKPDADEPGTSIVVWSSNFAAKGKPDTEAKGVIAGIFKSGLESLAGKAGK